MLKGLIAYNGWVMSGKSKSGYSTRVEAYVWLVRSAEHLHSLVSRGLIPHGLTPSQYSTLKVLVQRGEMMQRDIASFLLKTGGNVTMVVDNLERMGLVLRRKSEVDRRQTIVAVTEEGRKIFGDVYPGHIDDIESVLSKLTDEECATLTEILEKVGPDRKFVCPDRESVEVG